MIDKLTPQQEAQIQVYLKKWLDIGYRVDSIDKTKAVDAVHFFYEKILKISTPEIHFVSSPKQAQLLCNKLVHGINENSEKKVEYFNIARSNWWMSYYAFYDYVLHVLFPEKVNEFQQFTEFLEHSKNFHMLWTFDKFTIVCDFPCAINLDEEHKLHSNFTGALIYRDEYQLYSVNGETMKKDVWLDKTKQYHSSLGKEVFKKL